MKKLLLSILTIAAVQVFAQNAKLAITLTGPASGTLINNMDSVKFDFYIKNTDAVSIAADDSIAIRLGFASGSTFIPMRNYDVIAHGVIAAGDSIFDTRTYPIPMAPGTAGSGNICLAVYHIEANMATFGNASCKTYLLLNGVSETEKLAQSVNVYPNPATTNFTVTMKSTSATVDVLDITGKLIESAPVTMGEARFNVSNYNNGVYFYQIKGENNSMIKSGKFVVSH